MVTAFGQSFSVTLIEAQKSMETLKLVERYKQLHSGAILNTAVNRGGQSPISESKKHLIVLSRSSFLNDSNLANFLT